MVSEKPAYRPPGLNTRLSFIAGAMMLGLAILGVRLWNLQIIHGEDHRRLAEDVRLTPQRVEAKRGIIYGTNAGEQVILADNRPAYDLVLVPAHCNDPEQVCADLARLIGIDEQALLAEIEQYSSRPFRQIVVKEDISKNELLRVEEYAYRLRGTRINVRPQRRYPFRETGGQLIGYLSEINRDELQVKRDRYRMGDLLGRAGLEAQYESTLKGDDGMMTVVVYAEDQRPQIRTDITGAPYFEVDSFGRKLEEVASRRKPAVPGEAIYTTLDIGLQGYCEELLEASPGAIAVLNAETGAVLALASSPSYDPSVFVTQGRSRERVELLNAKPSPMRNLNYQEVYPPGSTFKVLLAAAALEEGIITPNTRFHCNGSFQIDGRGNAWRCWTHSRGGHGSLDIVDAIAYSCNVFFYNVSLALGVDKINEYARKMGLGEVTGLDVPGEVKGLVPSPAWKEDLRKPLHPEEPWEWQWYPGETVNLSIGQGACAVTPLSLAVMTACILNGGKRVQPYLSGDGTPRVGEQFLSEATIETVIKGMRKSVEKQTFPSGTGRRAQIDGKVVLGKTGTAQAVSRDHYKHYENEEDIPLELRDHAWFVSGVLDREPKIAITVFVEHGLHGSSAAAPLARDVIEFFYSRLPNNGRPEGSYLAQEDAFAESGQREEASR